MDDAIRKALQNKFVIKAIEHGPMDNPEDEARVVTEILKAIAKERDNNE